MRAPGNTPVLADLRHHACLIAVVQLAVALELVQNRRLNLPACILSLNRHAVHTMRNLGARLLACKHLHALSKVSTAVSTDVWPTSRRTGYLAC